MRLAAFIALVPLAAAPAHSAPENLARKATVSATSEYNQPPARLLAKQAIDGLIPEMLDHEDWETAWAVDGAKWGNRVEFALEWEAPVRVAEIIYYGRTSWLIGECFRQCEVRVDDQPEVVAHRFFEMNAGPQRIPIDPPRDARKVTLTFVEAYQGSNPGAAEIEVYPESPSDADLPKLKHLPTNHALQAKASATSEYSEQYVANWAIDGRIPEALSRQDGSQAWATQGATSGGKADLTLEWAHPVTVQDVVYHGRCAILIDECMKEYELYLDDGETPVATGEFQRGSGAQVVSIEPREARKLTLRFSSHYGGPNPGASEVQVYSEPAPLDTLPPFRKDGWDAPTEDPALAEQVAKGELGFDTMAVVKRYDLNPSHVYTICCEGFAPGGGLYTLSPPRSDGEPTELVASPEGQIMDIDVSWDGKQILFSWRENASVGYHVYTVNADGTGLTQLTDGHWHDYNACWLPDGGIAFLSTRSARVAMCFFTPSGVLYRMDGDGGNPERLSSNYVNDFTPSVLPDGRILYGRWEYVDKPAIPIQSLWSINPDGTGLAVYYGNRVLSPASFIEARPIPGTTEVMSTLTAHNGPIRGGVATVNRYHGVNAQQGIVNLTPKVGIGLVDQGSGNQVQGWFEQPYPIDSNRFLVAGRGGVYLGDREGRWALVKERDGDMGYFSPQPLRPREKPPVVASALPEALADEETATVYLLDVYDGLEPYVKRGEVKEIAVVQEMHKDVRTTVQGFGFQRPVISCGATYASKKLFGYAPVEEDGSAYFKVPTDVPIYFEALDEHGRAVQRMRSFTHLRPGETQGCIGCHEHRASTPTVASATAMKREPSDLRPPDWGADVFDYPTVVQPVLDQNCVSCHSGLTPPKGLDLTGDLTDWFNVSYDNLTRGYVSWIDTRNGHEANILQIDPLFWGSPASKLGDIVISGHPDADGKPRINLDDLSQRRILAWIDLNVPYYSTYEMSDPNAEGGRRVYPADLEQKLAEVSERRCASCHDAGIPRKGYVRLIRPEMNEFLAGPLAKTAGGRGSCGDAVFRSPEDADYQALLETFAPAQSRLVLTPRMDMAGARPTDVDKSCM